MKVFDVPKGTLRGAPPVPDDDLTTLRTSLYLVAQKKLGTDLVTSLTQAIMRVRRDLLREQPIFAQITAPSTDQDAYLPLHPGAAAVYNSTTQSFMDEYGNWIYLTRWCWAALPPCLPQPGIFSDRRARNSGRPFGFFSMPLAAGFGGSIRKRSCRILKKKSTAFSKQNAPNPPPETRAR